MTQRKDIEKTGDEGGRVRHKSSFNLARWILQRSWIRKAMQWPTETGSAAQVVRTPVRPRSLGAEKPLAAPFDTDMELKPGLCIVGYFRSEIGLGQAARCLAYAADAAGLQSSFYSLPLPSRDNEPEFATKCIAVPDRKANLLVLGLPSISGRYGEIRGSRHNILYPFWELHRIEREWLEVAERCDEVWAPSTFVADAFRDQSKLPVTLVRQPLKFNKATMAVATKPVGPLKFLTYLDYNSYGTRKNPKATVTAFRRAFPLGSEDVQLIVKTRGSADRGLRDWLAAQCANERRLIVVDQTVDRETMDRMVSDCDVFVSLHRSEGFGFGAAEALAAGKAVIATDYSGTTDFINHSTGYPVAYRLIPVLAGEYVSTKNQVWADPDLDDAVAAMHAIHDQPDQARTRAEHGREWLMSEFSPGVIGAQMKVLLRDRGLL